ncbi:MAG: hypothetical protein ABSH38_00150 [Verrucomicrobiota bacterium]
MNEEPKKWLRSRRILRRCFYAIISLAALVLLFYAEEDWRGKRAWEQFKQHWEAKGERFDWASVIPPPVPDNENFALAPIVFSSYAAYVDKEGRRINPPNTNAINRLQMSIPHKSEYQYLLPRDQITNFGKWQIAEWTDLIEWQSYFRTPPAQRGGYRTYSTSGKRDLPQPPPTNEFPVAPQPQTPAADVLLALSRYDAAIAELRQASRLPHSRFPLNYEKPEERLFAHHGSLDQCAGVLQLRSVAELAANRTDEALEDIKLALRLAESVRPEPFYNSQRARIYIIGTTLQPIWEGLAARRWSDSQLLALESELSGLDFFSDYATTVRGQRALASAEIDRLRRTHNESNAPEPADDQDNPRELLSIGVERLLGFYFHSFPSGWYYQNQLRTCRAYTEELLPLLDAKTRTVSHVLVTNDMYNGYPISSMTDMTDRVQRPSSFERRNTEWWSIFTDAYSILESMVMYGVSAGQFAYAQGSTDLARVACALERYRLSQGEYPASLDALVPRFMDKLPHDLINGQPLHYRLTDNRQFVLYSVGWANRDEHGKVRYAHDQFGDVRNGNWVWRYP